MYPGDVLGSGQMEKAAMDYNAAGSPRRMTRRQQLEYRRQQINAQLEAVDKALAALDAHPELEEFIETLVNANM